MKYIIANWKMNMTAESVLDWCRNFSQENSEKLKIVVSPTYVHLPLVHTNLNKRISIAAQDVSLHPKGAHTGEVGAFQLKEFCEFCIVGHSERKENLEVTQQKIAVCLENSITPIVCFRDIETLSKLFVKDAIWTWEDPENISKNNVYNVKPAEKVAEGIKELRTVIGTEVPLLYGGSVNGQNAKTLAMIDKLDGVLVGAASCNSSEFSEILNAIR